VASRQCTIPLLALQDSPYLLVLGDSVRAIVSASNAYGESSASPAGNGATIVTVPDAPVGLSNDLAITTASVIGIKWNNGVSTGGSAIIDYRVSYDQSVGSYVVLATGVVPKTYTTSVSLTPGATYNFKVEARNSVGYSLISTAVTILAA
jgi:hypothetical protein